MRFPTAWADIAAQNATLKFVIAALAVTLVTIATVAAKLGMKDPVVVERSCFSKTLASASAAVTDAEVKGFVEEVLVQRFGSTLDAHASYLSPAQLKARTMELDDLRKKGMRQTLIVNAVTINGEAIKVEADRLIAVDKIRSAFPVILDVEVSRTSRTTDNPYGLILTKVSVVETKDGSK